MTSLDNMADEIRVALVVGNGAYLDGPLLNPTNDSRAVAARLRGLGFEVIERENVTQRQIGPLLRDFRSKLKPGAVSLFFYAGHGLQLRGENYLPVVDAVIESEDDVPTQSLNVSQVLSVMEESKTRLNLVFLDACRNNPYSKSFRSTSGGLARLSPPSGTLVSFATRPGSVASDGKGKNGLYTHHLLGAMNFTHEPIELVLKKVVSGVKRDSRGTQEPWMEGSIEGDFCLEACGERVASQSQAAVAAVSPNVSAPSIKPNESMQFPPRPSSVLEISGIVLSETRNGEAQEVFRPSTSRIHVRANLVGARPGSKLKADWVAVNAEGAPRNYRIDTVESVVGHGATRYDGSFSRPTAGWPIGDYRVDLSIDGKPATQAAFRVVR